MFHVETWLIVSLALSVAANQTFSSVGPVELILALSIMWAGFLTLPDVLNMRSPLRYLPGILLLASICISAVMGIANDATLPDVFRSAAPYMLLSLALPYMVSGRVEFDREFLLRGVTAVAALHSLYLLAIYFVVNDHFDAPSDILVNRITIIDNRGINPAFLVGSASSVAVYALAKSKLAKILAASLATASILAAVATIARTFAIASVLGPLSILTLSLVVMGRKPARKAAVATVIVIGMAGICVASIPAFSVMLDAMLLRHETQVASGTDASGETTVGGGRLTDEWPSAWKRYTEGTIVEKVFGIGAGNPFTLNDGTERTYVHNWPLYLILYQGIFGVVAFTIFITTLALTTLYQWWKRDDVVSLACLGILATMYSSAMFFANHKLISFNLLLVIVYLMSMPQQHVGPLPRR